MISLLPNSCNMPKAILPELRLGKMIVFTSLSANGENGYRFFLNSLLKATEADISPSTMISGYFRCKTSMASCICAGLPKWYSPKLE